MSKSNLIQDAKTRVDQICVYLMKKHQYIGYVFLELNRVINPKCKTALVRYRTGNFTIEVNPSFIMEMSVLEAVDIIQHEVLHLLFNHLDRGKTHDQKLSNVAADFSCNSFLSNLPKFNVDEAYKKFNNRKITKEEFIKLNKFKVDSNRMVNMCLKAEDYGLPERLTYEEYYKLINENEDLKKHFSKNTKSLKDMTQEEQDQLAEDIKNGKVRFTFGEGEHDEDCSGDVIKSEELRRILKEAQKKSVNAFGNLPSELQREILNFLNPTQNWKKQLQSFIFFATEISKTSTRMKRNRRYGITYPGRKKDYYLNLCTFTDSSGSMSNEDIELILPEINKIYETTTKSIRVMSGDTELHSNYKMKKMMKPTDFNVKGGGGTHAQKWLEAMSEEEIDCAVIFTDGFIPFDDLTKPKYPVLWCLTLNGCDLNEFKQHIPFGKVIKLNKNN